MALDRASGSRKIVEVAVPVPLYQCFDYDSGDLNPPAIGTRVQVPFGRRRLVGIVTGTHDHRDERSLRSLESALDASPLFEPLDRELIEWTARYFAAPIGEVYSLAMPVRLRAGAPAEWSPPWRWHASETATSQTSTKLGRRQQAAIDALLKKPRTDAHLREISGLNRRGLERLASLGLVRQVTDSSGEQPAAAAPAPALSAAQSEALQRIGDRGTGFHATLVDGVTGSGKTEVYLHAARQVVEQGGQCLILVPEIGLVGGMIERVRARLGLEPCVLHSGMADGERAEQWLAARAGHPQVVIATRSGVFVPIPRLGLIIVDEEHDGSFKQEDGCRYSARSVAIWRARQRNVPILLGSATPSLESLHLVDAGQFHRVVLPSRAGGAELPRVRLLDVRAQQLDHGLCFESQSQIETHLQAGGQVLVFLNRRGYAPAVMCHTCGWVADCSRCDAHLTLHRGRGRLCCHHCGLETGPPQRCPDCGDRQFAGIGAGTERLEHALSRRFAGEAVLRIDRDTTRRVGELDARIARAESGDARILIGTQMLAKGHNFPNLSLVVVVDADQGLFSADFRAAERMAQGIFQVGGRAGRAERAGEVLIQTHHPDHPLLQQLVRGDYSGFSRMALAERREAGMPPARHFVMLRAEGAAQDAVLAWLGESARIGRGLFDPSVAIWDPIPAPMARRAGRHRGQLLLECDRRAPLQSGLSGWIAAIGALKLARSLRWSVDVDPQSML